MTERVPRATDTYLLLRALCQELARCGMTDACTSPGSRSTPLVLSLAREPGLRAWSHLDERVAGFFALGLAKASGRPVAVACTSGTAAAELAPAVIEAHEARVPLVVLTADRPPELRDVGAGQTIDQLKLYGGAVKQFVELGTHYATPSRIRWIRALACRLVWTALDGRPGPVHVNVPLREPLVLDGPLPAEDPVPPRSGGRPWVARPSAPDADDLSLAITRSPRTVVVVGREEREPLLGEALAAFAVDARFPLLADPLSGARLGPNAIAHYDALLRDETLAAELRPELVLRVGDLPTSKPLRTWLAGLGDDVEQVSIDGERSWHDPSGVVSARIDADPLTALVALTEHGDAGDPGWLARWQAADAAAGEAIAGVIGSGADAPLNEPLIAAELVAALPAGATLFAAASRPIRDLETFAAARETPPRVLSNRGANGIDGTVAAALGAAAAGGPVVLHIGDVALAYDLTALISARRLDLDLTIVLVNNDGGGIFHFLPVAGEVDAFEEHVATPHGLDFAQAAATFGARHVPISTAGELRDALGEALGAHGVTILEARTERAANLALHRRVADAVGAALS